MLAQRFDAEIVGADSRQVYRDMPIGTAAPTTAQRARVPHHLIDFVDPHQRYSAARYVEDALAAIELIHRRGKHAIVTGGTGFYVRALCGDVKLSSAYDADVRGRLAREARIHPRDVLHGWLGARDPLRAAAIDPGDRYRVLRALEIGLAEAAGKAQSPQVRHTLRAARVPFVKTWIEIEQVELDRRIGERVDAMLAAGLIDEAERIGDEAVAADAVGYRHSIAFLRGWSTRSELRDSLLRMTRRYAKRQRTWFRTEPEVRPIPFENAAERLARLARDTLGWT